ncbi:uncharacterized protein LOC143174932 [Nomia melanderi]|uniref:uncharacterized protein LOC143174932 n=1 Tax=Nomia melanderi TaxID=2448451 RepID=UPI003FCD11A9
MLFDLRRRRVRSASRTIFFFFYPVAADGGGGGGGGDAAADASASASGGFTESRKSETRPCTKGDDRDDGRRKDVLMEFKPPGEEVFRARREVDPVFATDHSEPF